MRITATAFITKNLKVGDLLKVAQDELSPPGNVDGFMWLQGNNHTEPDGQCGWVKWEPVVDEIASALIKANCYNDGEPLRFSIDRLVGERDTEREYSKKLRAMLTAASEREVELNKRIKRLESELLRVQAPVGTSFGFKDGKTVPQGWKQPPLPELPEEEPLRARCGRQRRELRRLNQSQRLLKLQLDKQERTTEDVLKELLDTRAALRVSQAL